MFFMFSIFCAGGYLGLHVLWQGTAGEQHLPNRKI